MRGCAFKRREEESAPAALIQKHNVKNNFERRRAAFRTYGATSGRTRNSWVSMVRKISQYRSAQPPSIDFSTNTYIYSRRNTLCVEEEKKEKKNGEKRREKKRERIRRNEEDILILMEGELYLVSL